MKVEVGGNDTRSLKSPVSYSLNPELPDFREFFQHRGFFHGFNLYYLFLHGLSMAINNFPDSHWDTMKH